MTSSLEMRSKRLRLCLLTQYFPPEMGAPQARLSELGERLAQRGWSVETLTALPNYPTGRIFPGYARLKIAIEQLGAMRVVRVPLYPSKTGFARRMLTYMSFAASAAVYGSAVCSAPDLLFIESPPLFIGLAGLWLARWWGCPYVFNVSDLWPDSAIHMGVIKPGLLTHLAEGLERTLYRRASGITGQSQEIVEAVRKKVPGATTRVITNGVDPSRFGAQKVDAAARELLGDEPGPICIFAGLLGLAQGLDQILDLAVALPPDLPGRFVLIGDGPAREALLRRVEHEQIHRVRILPAQARERIPALLAAADVALISLGMSIPGAVPSKIYEAMASGLPILLVAEGEAARRVETAQAGLAVCPGDREGLRLAFQRLVTEGDLRQRLGSAGRRAAEGEYNRDHIALRLDEFLRECVQRSADQAA